MPVSTDELVACYQQVFEERFRDMPIVNDALCVEAVGFRDLAQHRFGALITPWFINLVLLPGTGRWDERPQGSMCKVELPGGKIDFTVSQDTALGTHLSAALFSTVADFPDQAMARDIAAESLRLLFTRNDAGAAEKGKAMSRRQLLQRLGGVSS